MKNKGCSNDRSEIKDERNCRIERDNVDNIIDYVNREIDLWSRVNRFAEHNEI